MQKKKSLSRLIAIDAESAATWVRKRGERGQVQQLQSQLTRVLVGGDDEPETVVRLAVGIRRVVQREKVARRVDGAHFGAGTATR